MDAYRECAAIVRERDPDRYLSDLFSVEESRHHLFALHAFNAEVARVRDVISEPMPGEIRLQWWRDVLSGGEGGGHPVANVLNQTIKALALPLAAFDNLLKARIFDLYNDPMPSLNDLEGYAGETSSVLIQLGALTLAGGHDEGTADVAGHAGVAYALAGLMRALPLHASRGQMYLPRDMMAAFGVVAEDVFAGRPTPALQALLVELRSIARRHLEPALTGMRKIDPRILPAFLPVLLVEPRLKLMDRKNYNPFATPAELWPWRRQWILWSGVRRGR
ncbi:MAG: phytoene/squalene synthase family protein [Bauldia sp.]